MKMRAVCVSTDDGPSLKQRDTTGKTYIRKTILRVNS